MSFEKRFAKEFGDFEYRYQATASRVPINTKEGVFDLGTKVGIELKNEIKAFIAQELKREREEIVKQLEMTILYYEKDMYGGEGEGIVESLEGRIRAYIRHELKEKKKGGKI